MKVPKKLVGYQRLGKRLVTNSTFLHGTVYCHQYFAFFAATASQLMCPSCWYCFVNIIFFFFRVVFGPELVMLGPDEQFTQLSLSGGKPKRPNVIKSLCLLLGPDFCTDIITIETADHARLQLQLSYNW